MPQIDTAQRRAEAWARRVGLKLCGEPGSVRERILAEEWQQARREALAEAAKVVSERAEFICHDYDQSPLGDLEWFHRELIGRFADYLIDAIDRLREGVEGQWE